MDSIALPDSLIVQLRAFESRLRKMETLSAVAGGLAGLLVTFVLLFVSDRFIDTPRWARVILTIGGGALAAWFAHAWGRHWLWNRRGPAQLAKLLQRHFRALGDRLQGVIELTETQELPANLSPALLRAAIRQVAEESGRFDFTAAVPVRPVRRRVMTATVIAVLGLAPFLLVPKAARNALARWMAPWAQIERYTFASLEHLPAELVVPHGEAFEVAFGLRPDSAWKPETATARLGAEDARLVALDGGRAIVHLEGQTHDSKLRLRVGDATREITIRPMHRPEMKELSARVTMPAYLQQPEANVVIQGSSAEFLEGSRVQFAGKTSRALKEATLLNGGRTPAARVENATFITPAEPVEKLGTQATFRWADVFGLTPTQPYHLRITTSKDAEPRVELQGIESDTAILPNEVLKLNVAANDDYGVKEAWLSWTVRPLSDTKKALSEGEANRRTGAPTSKDLASAAQFSPMWYQVPENSVIELTARAVDYLPDRKPATSWRHTVYVLSPAKHAERVRERMDQVLRQLDERIRDEERQLEETSLLMQNKSELAGERAVGDIKRVEASERTNQAQLEKLTSEMHGIMKDALRNKDVPEGTVADWKQLTEQLEQQANPPMQSATQALQQAGQQVEQRAQQLALAQQQQQKALDAMRSAAKRMSTTNQNLYARNFYNRMRAAAAAEYQISDGMKILARSTVGLKPEEIDEEKKQTFYLVATRQENATREVDSLLTDMMGFLKRLPNDKYDAVVKQMQEKRVVPELNELSAHVRANLALKSVSRARQWGAQMDEWATMLQTESNSQGGGEGEMDPDLLELIVALVRAAQIEDNIREQTTALEARKAENPHNATDAKELAKEQDTLISTLSDLRVKTKFQDVKPLLEDAEILMEEVAGNLREAKTDKEVVSLQSTIIEMLVPPDKKGAKQGTLATMQGTMRQMMAQSAKGGGGNRGRFASNAEGIHSAGSVSNDKKNARAVDRTGGAANAGEWPEEYRDQLQAYFQQVEASDVKQR